MKLFLLSRFNTVQRVIPKDTSSRKHSKDPAGHERRAGRRMRERRFNGEWMEQRLDLMRRYTAPSVKAQTDNRFDWFVFVQAGTPQSAIKRIEAMGAQVIVATKDDVQAAQDLIRKHRGMVASVNLDTDDALAPNFVEEFLAHAPKEAGKTMAFLRGMVIRQITGKELYSISTRSDSNPFQGLVEDAKKAETIFSRNHKKVDKLVDLKQPMWLQVVHGDNIDNWKMHKSKKDQNVMSDLHKNFPVSPKTDYGRNVNR